MALVLTDHPGDKPSAEPEAIGMARKGSGTLITPCRIGALLMNDDDDDPRYVEEPPEWVLDIIDKHDLFERTDCPLAAATVLLIDAADILKHTALQSHRDQAITSETLSRVHVCAEMIADAVKLSELCPSSPVATEKQAETMTRSAGDNVHYL